MARKKDKECPICGEMYSSQGMVGHLSNGHGLGGQKLKEEYRKVVPEGGDERESRIDKYGSSDESPVVEAIQQVAKWKGVLRAVNEENYREGGVLDMDVADMLGDEKKEAVKELKEKVKERLDQARKEYIEAVAQRANRDE